MGASAIPNPRPANRSKSIIVVPLLALTPSVASGDAFGERVLEGEWFGSSAIEIRFFPEDPLDPRQHEDLNLSLSMTPEYEADWSNGRQSLTITPFVRVDQQDRERTHVDLREFLWELAWGSWEVRAGVGRVFWGVTESRHLVDIVNQTDLVENLDEEDKLGQPMAGLTWITRTGGTLDLYLLPGFRERTFPGSRGRLRAPVPVDEDRATIESPLGRGSIDGAIRWSHSLGQWDWGVYGFYGTSREPRLLPELDQDGNPVLAPRYDTIAQVGTDVQWTIGGWLWKLESIGRSGQSDAFAAVSGGVEYTFGNLFDTGADVGLLAEGHWDGRDAAAGVPFDTDAFGGVRLALNDEQSTALLAGSVIDVDTGAAFVNVEAARRLGERWKLAIEGRAFVSDDTEEPLSSLRRDHYVQAELQLFF